MRDASLSRRRLLKGLAYGGLSVALGRSPFTVLKAARATAPTVRSPLVPLREILSRADIAHTSVFLTVDDWFDREMVELALDITAQEKVGLTFFPIGRLLARNADLVRRAAREGHELENHTWDHQRLDLGHCPIAKIPGEIEKQFEALRAILGPSYRQLFLRPPGGFGILGTINPHLVSAATDAGLRIAMWSTDSQGWRAGRRSDPWAVDASLMHVLPGLAPGQIVLEHAIPADILALRAEIRMAKERGLQVITMAEGIAGLPAKTEPVPIPVVSRNPGY